MRAEELQQLFVKRRAGRVELLLVLESPSGYRERRTVATPATDELAAIAYLARYLAQDGSRLHPRLRVRRESGGELVDAPALKAALLTASAGEDAG